MKQVLSIDIETFSSVDIGKHGVYKYVDSPDFEVLLICYSLDGYPVVCIDMKKPVESVEEVAEYTMFKGMLQNPNITKRAYNATFERVCLSKHFGIDLDVNQWECSMGRSAQWGYPLGLQKCSEAMHLPGKLSDGKKLIKLFCTPQKPTKANGMKSRILPEDAPEEWKTFKSYCVQDVQAEMDVMTYGLTLPVTDLERAIYIADQHINDRGVQIDTDFARAALKIWEDRSAALLEEMKQETGLENPNSVSQLLAWVQKVTGDSINSLRKADVADMIAGYKYFPKVQHVLRLRQELGKTSVKKYDTMLACACHDGRVRGITQYYGTRTGRWAGRLVQTQNLPQNHIKDLDLARKVVNSGDVNAVQLFYDDVADTLSQLIRTAFVAPAGKTLAVCDFSAIEARVIAWVAGEKWRLDVFRSTGKIYEASAAMMFHCRPDEITKTDPRRQKGKIAELALGYGGGLGAMKSMGGERMGLTEMEMREIITKWRAASPNIVKLWNTFEKAAICAIKTRQAYRVNKGITFHMIGSSLAVLLPSGRCIVYPEAQVTDTYEGESISFMGMNQTTKKWGRIETYGGKITENIIQAIARDALGEVIVKLDHTDDIDVVFHVHDEVVCEVPEMQGAAKLQQLKRIFAAIPTWAEGLPLKGDGYVTKYYLKD